MTSIEIADAYVTLHTQMPGVKRDIENAVGKADVTGAGEKLGDNLGKGITNKQAAIAGAVGGIFASLANTAASAFVDLFSDAVAQSDAGDKFVQTLNFAGLDTSAIDEAVAKSKAYADSTVYDMATIQNTTAQLAANGITNYSELTEAAGNLNAVAGGNADTFSSVAMMLTQTAGAGKLTTENWNQLADAIPGASGRLQDALAEAGAYTGNFRDAMAEGQITADEFNAALLELGNEPVAVEAATSVETMEGATGNLAASITSRLADAFTTIKPVLAGFTALIADFISNSDIFIPVISGLAGALIIALAPAIWAAVTATWAFTAALLANPLTWIVLAIGLLIAGIVALAMNWDTVVAWISEVWGGFIGWITGVIDGFVSWWNGVWGAVGQFISDVWNNIVTWISEAVNNVWTFITDTLTNISNAWNAVWEGIGSFLRDVWNNILGWIEGGVNGAIDLINGLMAGIRDVAGFIGIEVGEIPHISIPRLADGGVVRGSSTGTLALVGEAGRGRDEAVLPLPPDWRENGLGGGKGATVNVYTQDQDPVVVGQTAAHTMAFALRGA